MPVVQKYWLYILNISNERQHYKNIGFIFEVMDNKMVKNFRSIWLKYWQGIYRHPKSQKYFMLILPINTTKKEDSLQQHWEGQNYVCFSQEIRSHNSIINEISKKVRMTCFWNADFWKKQYYSEKKYV